MSGRRRSLVFAACAFVVALATAGVAIVTRHAAPPAASPALSAVTVPLVRAALGRYVTRVHAVGRVGMPSGGDVKLAFASTGRVANVEVRVSQNVRADEPLAELDASGLALDAMQARSDATAAAAAYDGGSVPSRALAAARARLMLARMKLRAVRNGSGTAQTDRETALAAARQSDAKLALDRGALERQTTLYSGGVVARKDVEAAREALALDRADADANRAKVASAGATVGAASAQARADVIQAESDVRGARAQVTIVEAQSDSARARYAAAVRLLQAGTLRAPQSGVVIAVLKHPGEVVDATQPVIDIQARSPSDITLTLSANDAARVRPGDTVTMDMPGRVVARGRVRAVLPNVEPATQTATVVVDGALAGVAPGAAVEASIAIDERRGIVIPTSAIVEDPQSGRSLVFVHERARDGTERFVSHGIAVADGDDRQTLVASGLHEGDRVASEGAFDLLAPSGGK